MDRLIFLGTAGDIEVMARQRRASGGIILLLEGSQFHLDPGPGSLLGAKLFDVAARDTVGVIATNGSILRSNDVNAVVAALTLGGLDRHGILLGSESVIEGAEAAATRETKLLVEGVVTLASQGKVGVNHVTFYPVKTMGADKTGIGLKIATHTLLIGYTGDTAWYETMGHDYEGCDLLILNVQDPEGVKQEHRMSIGDAERLLTAVKPKAAFLTGFGNKLLDQDVVDVARQLQRKTKVDMTAATDGLVVELEGFKKAI